MVSSAFGFRISHPNIKVWLQSYSHHKAWLGKGPFLCSLNCSLAQISCSPLLARGHPQSLSMQASPQGNEKMQRESKNKIEIPAFYKQVPEVTHDHFYHFLFRSESLNSVFTKRGHHTIPSLNTRSLRSLGLA